MSVEKNAIEPLKAKLMDGLGISAEAALEAALHLDEIVPDLRRLADLIESASTISTDEAADELLAVMLHMPAHLMAATYWLNLPLTDTFQLGLVVDRPEGDTP